MQENLAEMFEAYFDIVFANTEELKRQCYKIRYDVYCTELNFEDPRVFPEGLEVDDCDQFSHHYLIKHKKSNQFAGTMRIVDTSLSVERFLCPFESHCLHSINDQELHPNKLAKHSYCEVSRLAVPNTFRRRAGEEGQPYILEGKRVSISLEEQKTFPYIAVGLYLSAIAHIVNTDHLEHIYVMMEPRLARHLRRVGIVFTQIGDAMDYHGERAAYHVHKNRLTLSMHPLILSLYDVIEGSVGLQLKAQ